MKRLFAALPLLLLVGPGLAQNDKKLQSFTSEYFPLKVGYQWIYRGVDPKEKITITVESAEPTKRRTPLPNDRERIDLLESYVLRLTSGDKVMHEQILVTDDGIYRCAAAGKEITPPIKLLKLPPAPGDAWAINSTSETVALRGEFVVEETTLPGEKGKVWLSKTRDFILGEGPTAQRMEASYWFVAGKGIVKQHLRDKKTNLTITLEDFRPGKDILSNPMLKFPPPEFKKQ